MSPATFNESQRIAGCCIKPLDDAACRRYLDWLTGDGDTPEGADGGAWALGHFDDGVTWGRWDRHTSTWASGHEAAPDISPAIRAATLQELRIFGDEREVLIWRTSSGLRGREVTEPGMNQYPEMEPLSESRVLRGSQVRREYDRGFTCVADRTGAHQVLPIRITDQHLRRQNVRLIVRHYFEKDDKTGVVRVALTRLVALQGGRNDA